MSLTSEARGQTGTLQGLVYDADIGGLLPLVEVALAGTEIVVTTGAQGDYQISGVAPGSYNLVFSKEGYLRQVVSVQVTADELSEVADVYLAGDFTEMPEFVAEDIAQLGAGSEAALLELRFESPALLDSIGAELMSKAGASDAASALRLVSGATVADGKFAVVRGLPDRYVSSQLNGVRMPSADAERRAVELDQFPSVVIESIQVAKTFTPDQQGDASGGAVDVRLRGIPEETFFRISQQLSYNTNVSGRSNFLSYEDGGVGTFGGSGNDIQTPGTEWVGGVGVTTREAPVDFKWNVATGGKTELDSGWNLGGAVSLFYERDSSHYSDGRDDSYWWPVANGNPAPETSQGVVSDGDFKTNLFDIRESALTLQYGVLGTVGIEDRRGDNAISLYTLFSKTVDDSAKIAEDTRGKATFFPGYDPNDPTGPGNTPTDLTAAPYLRNQTLTYLERQTGAVILNGRHKLPFAGMGNGLFKEPELDWTLSTSVANSNEPDKRQFGSQWLADSFNPGIPGILPPFTQPAQYLELTPAANSFLGNLQRSFKKIQEESDQLSLNVKLPFDQWNEQEGYLKFGVFHDVVDRTYNQQTYSNFAEDGIGYIAGFDEFWSDVWNNDVPPHILDEALIDVDYFGDQEILAYYGMFDLPLDSQWTLIGGVRAEKTEISIANVPEPEAVWFPEGAVFNPVELSGSEADVDFSQDDLLPALSVSYEPNDTWTFRASYSQTVARQTFRELSAILQQEFQGGPIFVGNPDLQMSNLDNFDLRVDYRPYDGGLVSASVFYKKIEDPIEFIQRFVSFTFTTPVNYPEGELTGAELEVRHDLGEFFREAEGLSIGANATVIDSKVDLPQSEVDAFAAIGFPFSSRDATNAPEHLFNFYVTYDLPDFGTELGLFYTITGDTLVTGAGRNVLNNFIPDVYAKQFDNLNFSLNQRITDGVTLRFQAKNLTNPRIREVYRGDFVNEEITNTSFTRGREYSIALNVTF